MSSLQSNTLGNVGLVLSILSIALVFGIGLCALVGAQQGWIRLAGAYILVCAASSAFLGFLGATLGFAGLFGANRSRATAIVGLMMGVASICLFLAFVNAVGK